MSWRTLGSLAWRESRSARRRLLLATSSITLGVAALVAIDSFAANVSRSVREQSRTILGGDVALGSRRGLSDTVTALLDSLEREGHVIARETAFPAMAVLPRSGATRLSQVRAVSDSFPLYGDITTEPAGRWRLLRTEAAAIVDPGLLIALDASVGDTVAIGLGRFVIAATVRDAPGVPEFAQVIGPRVFIPARYAPETQLLVFGSTSQHEAFIRTTGNPTDLARDLRARLRAEGVRVRSAEDAERGLTEAIDQLRQFVGIVGMVALLLGGLGVASGVHAFVARKIDTAAVLRCLGASSRQVLAMYVSQAAVMGVIGAAIGALLGVAVQLALPGLAAGLLPVDVTPRPEPRAILLGLGVGAWVALIFALRPLLALRHVSPLQTLRRDVDSRVLRMGRDPAGIVVTLTIIASVLGIAFARTSEPRAALAMAGGTAAAIALLMASAWLLSWLARRFVRARWPYVVRQGLSNLYRPGNQTRAVMLALGFGAFLVTTLQVVQTSVLRRFDFAAAASRANTVFFDVQEDQISGLDSLVRASGAEVLQSVPIVTMRIASVGERRAREMLADTNRAPGQGRWALRWEYRSTYRDSTTAGERVVEGEWFSATPPADGIAELSLEQDIARDLRVKVGDVIVWDVQGVEIPARVTSLREVTWARFEPNFFAVFRPGALDDAPKQFVMVGRTAGQSATATLQRAVVARYPNISSIDLSLIRETVDRIVGRVSAAIRFLAVLGLVMGIPVMLSAIAATRRERVREAVLLKTLGATRGVVARIMAAEYFALGLLGSLTGVLLATAAAWGLVHFVFELPFAAALVWPAAIVLAMTVLTVVIGMLGAREVFARTPMEALRDN
ncbi:MAG TPA: FtsX-like permease family protein [Gemmatimonadaceae bacterium]